MIYLDKWIHIKYQNWHINYVMTIFWLSSTSVWKLRLKNSHEQKMFLFRCMDLSFWVNLVSNFLSKLCNVTTIFKSVKSFRTFFKQCINFFILKLLCQICGGEVEVILLIKPNSKWWTHCSSYSFSKSHLQLQESTSFYTLSKHNDLYCLITGISNSTFAFLCCT